MATTRAVPPVSLQIPNQMAGCGNLHRTANPAVVADQYKFSARKFLKMMKYERLRLGTYLLYGHQWPKMDVISPTELAKAGFFYVDGHDAVQCIFCGITIREWGYGEDAMEVHSKNNPKCPFVLGEFCGNIALEIDPDINSERSQFKSAVAPTEEYFDPNKESYNKTDRPKFQQFSEPTNRGLVFRRHWNSPLDCNKLIEAGFFCTGKADQARCFHCGGSLTNWQAQDDPTEEHARFFPECRWLIASKGQNYIEFVQFKTEIIQQRQRMDTSEESKKQDIECMQQMTYDNFLNMKQSAIRLGNKLERRNSGKEQKNVVTRPDLSNGPSSPTQKYFNKLSFLLECQELFQYLKMLEIIKPQSPSAEEANTSFSSQSSSSSAHSNETSSSIFSLIEDHENNNADASSPKSSSDEEDENKGRCNLECTICRDHQIEVVFVPCGHQLACRKCSEKFDKCPVCRVKIDSKVRTFFAH